MARSSRGFSLIELLVVISVIALLVAMLLPTLTVSRERARYIKWAAYSHSLRSDTGLFLYYNFEQQGESSHDKLWNRAVGDPFLAAKKDVEPEELHGNINGAVWTEGRYKGKGALEFNGLLDQVTTEVTDATDQIFTGMTLWTWAKWQAPAQSWVFLLKREYSAPSQSPWQEWALQVSNNGTTAGAIQTRFDGNALNGGWGFGNAALPGPWRFIAVTVKHEDGNTVATYYSDGEKLGTSQVTGQLLQVSYDQPERVYLGGWLEGKMDEAAAFNRALDDAQIKEAYEVGFPRN